MREVLIICFLCWVVLGYSQNSGSIGVPGDYPEGGTDDQTISISNDTIYLEDGGFVVVPAGGSDSVGVVIPSGELIFGLGTKEASSSDSVTWSSGIFQVDGQVLLSNLLDLSPAGGDKLLAINSSGSVRKTAFIDNFFTSDGTATGSRVHDFDAYGLTVENISNLIWKANDTWSFRTTANDISTNGISGLGMSITTTGATNSIFVTSGNDMDLSIADDLVFDSPDIIFEDALTTDNALTNILVRDGSTGEIKSRDASTLGSDGLGSSPTTGAVLFGQGTTTAAIDATNIFWDDSNNRLGIGTASPSRQLEIANTGVQVMQVYSTDAGAVQIRLKSDHTSNKRILGLDASDAVQSQMGMDPDGYKFYGSTTATNPLNIFVSGTYSNRLGINTATPSGALDIVSTTGALVVPRMTTTQRDALTATAGMIIYNTTTGTFQGYTTTWTNL